MASNPNLPDTVRAFTPGLVDAPQKPCIEPGRNLSGWRKSIRVDTRIPAEVVTESGVNVTGEILLLSNTGLQLQGNRQMVDCLQTGCLRFIRCRPATIRICFSLPSNLDPCDAVKFSARPYMPVKQNTTPTESVSGFWLLTRGEKHWLNTCYSERRSVDFTSPESLQHH